MNSTDVTQAEAPPKKRQMEVSSRQSDESNSIEDIDREAEADLQKSEQLLKKLRHKEELEQKERKILGFVDDIPIMVRDMERLSPGIWLNDVLLEASMSLIRKEYELSSGIAFLPIFCCKTHKREGEENSDLPI